MRIGIIGTGNMGTALARRLSAAGHDVAIAGRDVAKAQQVAAAVGGAVRAVPQAELARAADVLLAATPYAQEVDAILASGDVTGKVVVDVSNPGNADYSALTVGLTTSAAEEVARAVPGARVVKAFNTLFSRIIAEPPAGDGAVRAQVLYAGDDEDAKATVRALAESAAFEPVDAGPLRNARYLEPTGMLNIYLGYGAGMGTEVAPAWVHVA